MWGFMQHITEGVKKLAGPLQITLVSQQKRAAWFCLSAEGLVTHSRAVSEMDSVSTGHSHPLTEHHSWLSHFQSLTFHHRPPFAHELPSPKAFTPGRRQVPLMPFGLL